MATFLFAESQTESNLHSSTLFPLLDHPPSGRSWLIWTMYLRIHPEKRVAQFPAWILEPFKWVTIRKKHLQVTLGDLKRTKHSPCSSSRQQNLEEKSLEPKPLVSGAKLFFPQEKKKDCEVLEGGQNCFIIQQIHKTYTTNIIQNYDLKTDSVIQ